MRKLWALVVLVMLVVMTTGFQATTDTTMVAVAVNAVAAALAATAVGAVEKTTRKLDQRVNDWLDGPVKPLLALGAIVGLQRVGVSVGMEDAARFIDAPVSAFSAVLLAAGSKALTKRLRK